MHGVVYMGAGNMIRDPMAGADVPAMLLRGTRDPFTPPEVRSKCYIDVCSVFLLASNATRETWQSRNPSQIGFK